MSRQLCSYPLSLRQLEVLNKHGFFHVDDVQSLSPSELSKELKVTCNEALNIIKLVTNDITNNNLHTKSAFELLKEEERQVPIVTFCAMLDEILGGGVPIGKITEFCGAPGMGKTQFGMQLAVDAQIPEVFGGVQGEAIYIDCEGSFICERLEQIAKAAVTHIENIAEQEQEDVSDAVKSFTVINILSRVHVYRCHSYMQLIALSHVLPEFLETHSKVKIIILDSIAFHFRYDFEDMALRTRLLYGLVQSFMKMAFEKELAVVFMNQMTTKISDNEESKLIPALGQSWGHACTIRIILDSKNGQRYAHLFKSPNHEDATVPFDITGDGIRDAVINDDSVNNSNLSDTEEKIKFLSNHELPNKRQRFDNCP